MTVSITGRRCPLAACSLMFGAEHRHFYEHESRDFWRRHAVGAWRE
jgi:hypothetical protein